MGLRMTFVWSALTALSLSYGWTGLAYGGMVWEDEPAPPSPSGLLGYLQSWGETIDEKLGQLDADVRSCADGTKVDLSRWCDEQVDCPDGSDEWPRNCPVDAAGVVHHAVSSTCERICDSGAVCLKEIHICNGRKDCEDGSDETDCESVCEVDDKFGCLRNGTGWTCFPHSMKCDVIHECTNDVAESRYECARQSCPPDHRAKGYLHCNLTAPGWCIAMDRACDGIPHCPNGEDESPEECSSKLCETHECGPDQVCKMNDGVPECYCRKGMEERSLVTQFLLAPCVDIDECAAPERHCSHGCINRADEKMFECTCEPGYKMGRDGQTCHRDASYLLFFSAKGELYLAHHRFNGSKPGQDGIERVTEVHISNVPALSANPLSLAYNPGYDELYFIDRSDHHRPVVKAAKVFAHGDLPRVMAIRGDFIHQPTALTVDVVSTNMYISDAYYRHIVACRELSRDQVVCRVIVHGVNATALAVCEEEARLFYADTTEKGRSNIYATDLQGNSKTRRLIWEEKDRVTGLAYDFRADNGNGMVYWATESAEDGMGGVSRATMFGDRHQVVVKELYKASSLAVHENQIYVVSIDWGFVRPTLLSMFRKTDGLLLKHLHKEFFYQFGPLFLSEYAEKARLMARTPSHVCAPSENRCAHLCFPTKWGSACDCQKGWSAVGDTCVYEHHGAPGTPSLTKHLPDHQVVYSPVSSTPALMSCDNCKDTTGNQCLAPCTCTFPDFTMIMVAQPKSSACVFARKSSVKLPSIQQSLPSTTTAHPVASYDHCAIVSMSVCAGAVDHKIPDVQYECRFSNDSAVDQMCHCSSGYFPAIHGALPFANGEKHHFYLCAKAAHPQPTTPAATNRKPTKTSKAPTTTSKAPTSTSKTPTTTSKVPTTTTEVSTTTRRTTTADPGPACVQMSRITCHHTMGYMGVKDRYICLRPVDPRRHNCQCPAGYEELEKYERVRREWYTICIREGSPRPAVSPQCELLAEECMGRSECKCAARSMRRCRLPFLKHYEMSFDEEGVCSFKADDQCAYDPHNQERPSPCSQLCVNTPDSYICKCIDGYAINEDNVCLAEGPKFLLTSTAHSIQRHNISLGTASGYDEWAHLTEHPGAARGTITHFVYDDRRKAMVWAEAVLDEDVEWSIHIRSSPFDVDAGNGTELADVEVHEIREFLHHSLTYDPVTGVAYIFTYESVLACDFHRSEWCAKLADVPTSAMRDGPKMVNVRDRKHLWLDGTNLTIQEASLDFTNVTTLLPPDHDVTVHVNAATAIDIDYTQDRLYIASGGSIVSLRLDGSQFLQYNIGYRINHMAVFENTIYFASDISVFRLDKTFSRDDHLPEPHHLFHHHELFGDLAISADVMDWRDVPNPCNASQCTLKQVCVETSSERSYTCLDLMPKPSLHASELTQAESKSSAGLIAAVVGIGILTVAMAVVYLRRKGLTTGPALSLKNLQPNFLTRQLSGLESKFRSPQPNRLARRLSGIGVMFRRRFDSEARRHIIDPEDITPTIAGSTMGGDTSDHGIDNPAYLDHHQSSPSGIGEQAGSSLFPADQVFTEPPHTDDIVSAIAQVHGGAASNLTANEQAGLIDVNSEPEPNSTAAELKY